ncbi:Potassium-transporting ATPase C chain [compost metagenome]
MFPKQANGSLIQSKGMVIGSELLSQNTASPKLFHPRKSAGDFDPTASTGSNRAVASEEYVKEIQEQVEVLRKDNAALKEIPADLITTSGSALDPDLSPEAAKAQIPRISRAAGITEQRLLELVDSLIQARQLGVFGEPRVNVLALNIELLKLIQQ